MGMIFGVVFGAPFWGLVSNYFLFFSADGCHLQPSPRAFRDAGEGLCKVLRTEITTAHCLVLHYFVEAQIVQIDRRRWALQVFEIQNNPQTISHIDGPVRVGTGIQIIAGAGLCQ